MSSSEGVAGEIFSYATDLAAQETREGRGAIANLILAEAHAGTFLDSSDPSRFLARLNEVILTERERTQGNRLPDDQIENNLQLSAFMVEARSSRDGTLPKELRGPLSTLPESTKTQLAISLKDASREELVALAGKVEELYVREGEHRWRDLIEESIDRCR